MAETLEEQFRLLSEASVGLRCLTPEQRFVLGNEMSLLQKTDPQVKEMQFFGTILAPWENATAHMEPETNEESEEKDEEEAENAKPQFVSTDDVLVFTAISLGKNVMTRRYFCCKTGALKLEEVTLESCPMLLEALESLVPRLYITPKGFYILDENRSLTRNDFFPGMDEISSMHLSSYRVLRAYDLTNDYAVIKQEGSKLLGQKSDTLLKSLQSFQADGTCRKDLFEVSLGGNPEDSWKVRALSHCDSVVLRNLRYPGFSFVYNYSKNKFASVYVGNAKECRLHNFLL